MFSVKELGVGNALLLPPQVGAPLRREAGNTFGSEHCSGTAPPQRYAPLVLRTSVVRNSRRKRAAIVFAMYLLPLGLGQGYQRRCADSFSRPRGAGVILHPVGYLPTSGILCPPVTCERRGPSPVCSQPSVVQPPAGGLPGGPTTVYSALMDTLNSTFTISCRSTNARIRSLRTNSYVSNAQF